MQPSPSSLTSAFRKAVFSANRSVLRLLVSLNVVALCFFISILIFEVACFFHVRVLYIYVLLMNKDV